MSKPHARGHLHLMTWIRRVVAWPFRHLARFWRKGWGYKIITLVVALVILVSGTIFGVGTWYIKTNDHKPLRLGVTFIPAYAESLGLNAEETMDALITEVGVRHFRLVSYWNQIEPVQDQYDFSQLDWQFRKVEESGGKVSLALGLRQPRWPECHMPQWAMDLNGQGGPSVGQWEEQLMQYLAAVVNRYKNSPALESYQLENEFLLQNFSQHCKDFDRARVAEELALVKNLDPYHPVIISRSNNIGLPLGQPRPDIFGISVYRRVWDRTTQRYFQYPFPPVYYAFLAGAQKILLGKDSILHELQAEAWPPRGQSILETSLEEQNKSFNAERFEDAVQFGVDTGMREIYLWGAEYWYYRKTVLHEPQVWNVAEQTFHTLEGTRND